jgi:hypothetical protein
MRLRALAAMIVIGLFVSEAGAAPTPRIDDPAKFVADVYTHIVAGSHSYAPPDDVYTPRLAALFALDTKEAGGEVGRLDFDPWTNAQDYDVKSVKISTRAVESGPTRRIVVAQFNNIGRPEEIHFYFEETRDGWKLDDIRSVGGEKWTLSLILKYGWDDPPFVPYKTISPSR